MPKIGNLFGPFFMVALACAIALSPQAKAQSNVPPPSVIFVRGGESTWLDFTNIFIARRAQKTTEAQFDFGTAVDGEGEALSFQWFVDTNSSSVADSPRFTNDFRSGLHSVHAIVSDGHEAVMTETAIEVLLPIDAIRRLRADLEISGVRVRLTHLRPVLRLAEGAIKHARWAGAERQLEVFGRRLPRRLNLDNEEELALYDRWQGAAEDLWQAVRRVPRHPTTTPGGVFPGN